VRFDTECLAKDITNEPRGLLSKQSKSLRLSFIDSFTRKILTTEQPTDCSSDLKEELDESCPLFAVSQKVRDSLNSRQDVKELILNLQVCIKVLKKHIPNVTKTLNAEEDSTIYATNVIQDLLKRAQESKLSAKILTDFTGIKRLDYSKTFSSSDINALVETLA